MPGLAGRSLIPNEDDPRGAKVPVEQQIAYFGTRQTTLFDQPVATINMGSVVAPIERSGLRTPEWRYVADQVVGPCQRGTKAYRDAMGAWLLRDATPVDEATCRRIRGISLYAVSPARDAEPNVGNDHPDLVKSLGALLQRHASDVNPLNSRLELSAEQQEKLRSLGYLK
jgi:hypothetical protein